MSARGMGQQPWHLRSWLFLFAFLVILIVMRSVGVEEFLRDQWRSAFVSAGRYDNRGEWQRILVAVLFVIATAVGSWLFYRTARTIRGRRNIAVMAALFCALAIVVLIAVRMVSLHAVDALLYGPLKLNWFADIGLSGSIAVAAIYYIAIVKYRK